MHIALQSYHIYIFIGPAIIGQLHAVVEEMFRYKVGISKY